MVNVHKKEIYTNEVIRELQNIQRDTEELLYLKNCDLDKEDNKKAIQYLIKDMEQKVNDVENLIKKIIK